MNLAELERKLIAAARANPPSDRVPYAFEKRIMARLAARSPCRWLGVVGPRVVARRRAMRGDHAAAGRLVVLRHSAARRRTICPRTLSRPCSRRWIRINPPTQPGE